MRSLAILPLLYVTCHLVQLVHGQCNIKGALKDKEFPDIEKDGVESYQLAVEYTLPKLNQTDYYTEYYDLVERQGRVDAHQGGMSHTYIYMTQSWEAWEVTEKTCTLKNITDIPNMMRDDMSEWTYLVDEDDEKRTFGPSAMFKNARDFWKGPSKEARMAYMGETAFTIRGLKAQYWRRCSSDFQSFIDYFFTTDDEKDPLGTDLKMIPLRVFFGGKREGMFEETSVQQYEIISLQPFISQNFYAFQLPKGRGCKRGYLADAPKLPKYADTSLQFGAEVIYRKVDYNGDDVAYWSYYSTLSMAIDVESDHIAYYYSNWNSTKPEKKEEPSVLAPEYIIFDMKHGYAYKNKMLTGTCEIEREKNFYPKYKLPNNGGDLALTDPTFLFPGPGMTYISEGINRGLKVYVFEEIIENYILNNVTEITVPKAIVTHSYLKDEVVERNSESVKNALVQIQVRLMGREEEVIELLTFNFFDFDTEVKDRRYIFNIQRCFKNDDDYVWVTIGFNADESTLAKIKEDVPSIQSNVLNSLDGASELNPVRCPIILVDVKEQLYVTMLILGKPPVLWDYLNPPEQGKTLKGATADVDGVQDLETCATKCLEEEDNCWAFSFCGAVCTFANEGTKVVNQKGCQLYRRYDNSSFLQSKEMLVQNIRRDVESKELKLVLRGLGSEFIQLDPSSIEVIEPGEDDRLISRIGNKPNPRMRVVKAGAKLKTVAGKPVKNLGNLGFDECQRVCLDYKDCETASFCVNGGECIVSSEFGEDIAKENMEDNNLCIIVTRKYSDLFNRSPGNVLSLTAQETLKLDTVEKCARACHKSSGYDCLSFDHCPQSKDAPCKLHTVHYPNSKTREKVQVRDTNCGHYYKKFSTEFKKNVNKRYLGSTIPPISNATLEECSKTCMEYKKGTCFGFDFCQDGTMMATTCVILNSDPALMKSTYSEVCTNFLRNDPQSAPRPYSNSYAGGIGFLCFVIGLAIGALVLFGIAYLRVNRH